MANSKIRIHSGSEYTIEVNDQGETISFDMQDTALTSKLFKMYEGLNALTEKYKKLAQEIDAREDRPISLRDVPSPDTGAPMNVVMLTQNQVDGAAIINEFYIEARACLDLFLGAGACQKIFGDKNYKSMFTDLLEQLTPEFKKMGLDAEKIKASAAKKHGPKDNKYRPIR